MRQLLDLVRRFRRDERGAFAVIFAVMAISIVALSGAAVDFTAVEHARTQAQVALDAAALALQPTIYNTGAAATIQTQAQALLATQVSGNGTAWSTCDANGNPAPCVLVALPVPDTVNGGLTLTATVNVPMDFVSLVGVTHISSQIVSEATRKKLNLEVSMVLDNSGSMATSFGTGSTRMTVLQGAAKCATNIIFYGSAATDTTDCTKLVASPPAPSTQVKMALVPFTMEVNVGTANASAAWLDRTGSGSNAFALDNFDSDDNRATAFTGPIDRVALFNTMNYKNSSNQTVAMSWGGCVEARKTPLDTDNTTPVTTNRDTLFTPFFAPDEPDQLTPVLNSTNKTSVHGGDFSNDYLPDASNNCKQNPTVVWTSTKSKCSAKITTSNKTNAQMETAFAALSCTNATANTYSETDQNGAVTSPSSLPATIYNNPVPSDYQESFSTSGSSSGNYGNVQTRTYYYLSDRVLQERMCKYKTSTGGSVTMNSLPSSSGAYGPNTDCPINTPITALTVTPATITTAIGLMSPVGGTNITEGAAWGFRTLSPGDPFNASAFDNATSKNLIIMTDGANTSYSGQSPDVAGTDPNMNGETYDSAYGFPWDNDKANSGSPQRGRLGAMGWPDISTSGGNSLEGEMNNRLLTVCANAKAANIVVYTIGVDTDHSVAAVSGSITTAQATALSAANKALLTSCATSSADAFFPPNAAALKGAFVTIANQLAALRLAR